MSGFNYPPDKARDEDEAPPTSNPGSDEAIDAGCTCPVMDNGHGKGYMCQPNTFVYTLGCPIHG